VELVIVELVTPTTSNARRRSLRLLHFILLERQIVLHLSELCRSRQLTSSLQILHAHITKQLKALTSVCSSSWDPSQSYRVVIAVTTSPSGPWLYRREGSDAGKRLEISPGCHCPGTRLWCQRSHQSTAGVLLPIECSAVSSQFPQWGQIGDAIWPMTACYEATEVSLLSITCHMGSHRVACHPTPVNVPHLTPAMQTGTRFTVPGAMEGWVDLGSWVYTEMVYLSVDGHPSK